MIRASIHVGRWSQLTISLLLGATTASGAQLPSETKLAAPNAALEHEFTRISAVRALSDGRVLVSDAGEAKLFVADFTRQTVAQIGRTGQGPNEYSAVASLFPLANDSTLLPDTRGGRWLLLHGSEIVAMVPADSPPILSGARNPLGADRSGYVLATRSVRSFEGVGSTTTAVSDSLWILRVARSTGNVDTIGKAAGRPARITVTGRERAQSVSVVVNPMSVGDQVVLYADGWVAVARVDPFRVDWIASDGRLIRGRNLPDKRVRVDQEVKRWFLEEIARQNGQPPRKPEDVREDWPSTVPPFAINAMLAAPDGTVWVRRAATEPGAPGLYDVVDREGHLVRRVVVARNERVVGFGVAAVYSVATDDDGIQGLRRHDFPR